MKKKDKDEQISRTKGVRSLNLADLDVEELEQRLELATVTAEGCYSFGCNGYAPPPPE